MTSSTVSSPHRPRTSCGWPFVTEHRTDEGKLYLCAIKDVWSNRFVGYSVESRMMVSLAVSALDNALAQRGSVGTIVLSHRGSSVPIQGLAASRRVLTS
jgi:transposase InsO family protein